jgi:hypothetical protein
MNWEAINAVAQLISSIGVVASLWYLAVQVHRNTRITRLAAQDSASTALRDVTRPFAENAESGRIWRIGLENLEALSADDKARFFHFAFQFLKAMETIHFHYIYGLMDESIWRGWAISTNIISLRPASFFTGICATTFSRNASRNLWPGLIDRPNA